MTIFLSAKYECKIRAALSLALSAASDFVLMVNLYLARQYGIKEAG